MIADLQAKNRNLEEKNKMLEEKCEQFSKDGKQIQQHLSTLLKSYQALEKRLSDVTAEKEGYINVSVILYYSRWYCMHTNFHGIYVTNFVIIFSRIACPLNFCGFRKCYLQCIVVRCDMIENCVKVSLDI